MAEPARPAPGLPVRREASAAAADCRVARRPSQVPATQPADRLVEDGAAVVKSAMHFSPGPHPALGTATPAWAENGRVVFGTPALLLPSTAWSKLIRHETIHALQQRLAPAEETAEARQRAERLAERSGPRLPSPAELTMPAPRLLAAPVTGPPAKGFDRLFGGGDGVIGEVKEAGVTVRAERSYKQLGISAPVDPHSRLGTSTMTDLQFMACGKKSWRTLAALAAKMRATAKPIAAANAVLDPKSPRRVELVLVANEESRQHFVDGQELVTISQDDFDKAGPETAAHEASHAVFDSHTYDVKDPTALAPDTFALRFADLFIRLGNTTPVPEPIAPFEKTKPRLKVTDPRSAEPAGYLMVADVLWQKTSTSRSDSHPWASPDELFASAYGAFLTDKAQLSTLIAYYTKADPSIKALGKELLDLLQAVKDPSALKPLADPAAAAAARATIKPDPGKSTVKDRLGTILTPETLPPPTVECPTPGK